MSPRPRSRPVPLTHNRMLLLLLVFFLGGAAVIGVREFWVTYHRSHTERSAPRTCLAQSCTTGSDCTPPQACVDGTCCLPAATHSPAPASVITDDWVRWNFGFR